MRPLTLLHPLFPSYLLALVPRMLYYESIIVLLRGPMLCVPLHLPLVAPCLVTPPSFDSAPPLLAALQGGALYANGGEASVTVRHAGGHGGSCVPGAGALVAPHMPFYSHACSVLPPTCVPGADPLLSHCLAFSLAQGHWRTLCPGAHLVSGLTSAGCLLLPLPLRTA